MGVLEVWQLSTMSSAWRRFVIAELKFARQFHVQWMFSINKNKLLINKFFSVFLLWMLKLLNKFYTVQNDVLILRIMVNTAVLSVLSQVCQSEYKHTIRSIRLSSTAV